MFYVYILKCADGSYYTGHTDNIDVRIAAHRNKSFSGYTTTRLPIEVVFLETFGTRDEAFAAERKIKGWSHAKKKALIAGHWKEIKPSNE